MIREKPSSLVLDVHRLSQWPFEIIPTNHKLRKFCLSGNDDVASSDVTSRIHLVWTLLRGTTCRAASVAVSGVFVHLSVDPAFYLTTRRDGFEREGAARGGESRTLSGGNADGIGRELDLVGHSALLEQLQVHFQELPQDLCERVRAIRAPNDCISVLLLGNHSAGKSSFINWYVGEKVQTTSVAMETAGVTLVRRGKKRTQWRGKMTLGNFPALERLGRLPGLCDHIVTEFSTSEKNAFRSLELIDTPGLVDGNVRYPFDVDAAMDELAKEASLVIVFLDPIGKALVGRCMKAVERLSTMHHSKMHYVLSKMDTVAVYTHIVYT